MSESATDKRIRELSRQLENEKRDHARTKNEKQQELERVWRLVPGYKINLMGVYPALRRLFAVLGEAADLQDPSRSAPVEDTMRVDFIHEGENASTSSTEAAVLTHQRDRSNVRKLDRELVEMHKEVGYRVHRMSKLIAGAEWEYDPPDGSCAECDKPLFQTTTGRRKRYCSDTCRQRASRNVTKHAHP